MEDQHPSWFEEKSELWPGQALTLEIKETLYHKKSEFQDILAFESKCWGKVLVLDGIIQNSERDEFVYHEMLSHVPLFLHTAPKRVLVVGGGDGGVLREISKHKCVETIDIYEIDKDVIEVSKEHFKHLAIGFADERVHVHISDANTLIGTQKDAYKFDVIIVDASDPVGVAACLYSLPFYQKLYNALSEDGVVSLQGESMWLHLELLKQMRDNLLAANFKKAQYASISIPTYPCGQIGVLTASKKDVRLDVPARTPTSTLQDTLKYYTPAMHSAAFVLPPFVLSAFQ
eukprot:Filipodium_phascolosomae@DN1474_c0_g1_i1.p1